MSYTLDQVMSLSQFANKIGVTPQTVTQWFDKAGADAPSPAATFGATRVFLTEELERLAADNASGAAMRAMGYVHPQKYAELESRLFESINEKNRLHLDNQDLNAQLDESQRVIAELREKLATAEAYANSIIEG